MKDVVTWTHGDHTTPRNIRRRLVSVSAGKMVVPTTIRWALHLVQEKEKKSDYERGRSANSSPVGTEEEKGDWSTGYSEQIWWNDWRQHNELGQTDCSATCSCSCPWLIEWLIVWEGLPGGMFHLQRPLVAVLPILDRHNKTCNSRIATLRTDLDSPWLCI